MLMFKKFYWIKLALILILIATPASAKKMKKKSKNKKKEKNLETCIGKGCINYMKWFDIPHNIPYQTTH